MNATATAQPRRRGWGVLTALRHLATGGRSRSMSVDVSPHERDRELTPAQRDRLAASLPFDGSDCD
jgi:hypothetical protein